MNDPLIQLSVNSQDGKVKKELRERQVEAAVCSYAKKCGIDHAKFTSPGRRSVPDRIFFPGNNLVFFIEFKAPGKKATPTQAKDHERRRANGYRVFVVDDIEKGKWVIDRMVSRFRSC